MTYEGWSNYETWAVKLWLDNEEPTYRDVTGEAEAGPSTYDFANWLESYVEDTLCADAPTSSLTADLFRSAWQDVDWREIAEAYLGDVEDDE